MPVRRSRSRRTVALIATATVASGGALLTAPAFAHAAPAGCTSTFNLFIPGTWETDENADPNQPVGMLKPIADALESNHGSQAQVYTLPTWPAHSTTATPTPTARPTRYPRPSRCSQMSRPRAPVRNSRWSATPRAPMPPVISPRPSETARDPSMRAVCSRSGCWLIRGRAPRGQRP